MPPKRVEGFRPSVRQKATLFTLSYSYIGFSVLGTFTFYPNRCHHPLITLLNINTWNFDSDFIYDSGIGSAFTVDLKTTTLGEVADQRSKSETLHFGYNHFLLEQVRVFVIVLLNWDSQQGRPFTLPSQRNFPISFKPKVAIAEFFWKMQRKTWYSILGMDVLPLSLKNCC